VRFLYRCLTYLYVLPLTLAIHGLRLFGRREDQTRLGLGLPVADSQHDLIWLVASSVGEVNVAARVIARLKALSDRTVLLTVTTKTGRLHAERLDCGADVVVFQPFDLPRNVGRFLKQYAPVKVILIETELWPTLIE
jgi:3-deoxy-D-manno-octulosonic-acid transferase